MAAAASAGTSGADITAWVRRGRILFDRALGVVLIGYGLYYWAIVIGVVAGRGAVPFEELGGPFQWATFNFAVAYPVAGVGLWMLVPWGTVVWLYAAAVAVLMSTVFAGTFGFDVFAMMLHLAALAGFVAILLLSRRAHRRGLVFASGTLGGSGRQAGAGGRAQELRDQAVQVKPGAET